MFLESNEELENLKKMHYYSRCGNSSTKYFTALNKKTDFKYTKPKTPAYYDEVRQYLHGKDCIPAHKKDTIFDTISRERRENLLSPRAEIPCVGHYTPSFKFSERSAPIIDFGLKSTSKSLALDETKNIRQFRTPNNDSSGSPKKRNSQVNGRASLSPDITKNIAIPETSFKESTFELTNLSPRMVPSDNDESKQQESVFGIKRRSMVESSSLPDINDPIKKKLPNIFFNKQSERKSLLISAVDPHEGRFENINKFPKILTNNTNIIRSVDFGKFTKRKEMFRPSVCQNEYTTDSQKFKYPKTIQCVLSPLKR